MPFFATVTGLFRRIDDNYCFRHVIFGTSLKIKFVIACQSLICFCGCFDEYCMNDLM